MSYEIYHKLKTTNFLKLKIEDFYDNNFSMIIFFQLLLILHELKGILNQLESQKHKIEANDYYKNN